ncbi:hypothetical protein PLEOSDRAFT_167588 [Pleurotus ostreatus PC15]|uniref:Uncharacterized protein n=1 Tax=Pleurotus ostreatus (strain PC15) TaxID=1137138 RepID=A0A067NRV3_PLEO1|nr:hypothetical protein PLEOSDRAFT_167588 [Pleurotus ostreatus PC15]
MSALIDFSILSSIAAIEIGILVSSVLFGIVTLQAFIYFRTYPGDPKPLKILLLLIGRVLEFGGMICVANLLYEATITKYRSAPLLMFVNPPTQINISNLISACTACLVEVWFAERVRRFTGLLWPALVFWFLIFVTFAGAILVSAVLFTRGLLEFTAHWRWASTTCWILSAVIDVAMASLLCFNLLQQRQSLFQRVMAITTTILSMTMPYNLYANSFFASLNARNNLRSTDDVVQSFKLSVRGARSGSAAYCILQAFAVVPSLPRKHQHTLEHEDKTSSIDISSPMEDGVKFGHSAKSQTRRHWFSVSDDGYLHMAQDTNVW